MSAMRRRELMILICGGATASIVSPVPLWAQQTGKVYRIGFLRPGLVLPLVLAMSSSSRRLVVLAIKSAETLLSSHATPLAI